MDEFVSMTATKTLLLLSVVLFLSCRSNGTAEETSAPFESNSYYDSKSTLKGDNDDDDETEREPADYRKTMDESGCRIEDGIHSATVDYYNPETGYSATYTLDVEVEDCQVVQIDFPRGGWLDKDHINYGDIDENGDAHIDGEDGKTYDVHIDY